MVRSASLVVCMVLAGCAESGAQPVATPKVATHTTSASPVSRDRPLVVVVRADWCPTCRKIEPTVMSLQREYGDRVSFLVLDVTDEGKSQRSGAAAESAGVGDFFRENTSTGVVAVFDRARKQVASLAGDTELPHYRAPLATALAAR